MEITREQWDELVAHARDEAPNECCGYLWSSSDGTVQGVARARNERKSPYGYELDSESMLAAWRLGEEDGYQVGTYHSHPRSAPEPSQTDINLASNWPDWLYVIVSLAGEPSMRAWWIRNGAPEEEQIHVVDGR
ncbi:MAG TPA: M67 family metallopeptidase [Thermoleophilaceae bacterium]